MFPVFRFITPSPVAARGRDRGFSGCQNKQILPKAYGYILLCLISNALRKGEEKAVFFLSFWGALSIELIMVLFLKLSWKGE